MTLDDLYIWFDDNRDAIISGHRGKHVLVKNNTVVAYFQSEREALECAKESGFPMGEFLIQQCIPKDEECMYYYNEAVSFG